ncbi:MAG TPA: hypothetical protein PLQ76_09995 [bacterium]|nr:hypothetical protein [bacterium]
MMEIPDDLKGPGVIFKYAAAVFLILAAVGIFLLIRNPDTPISTVESYFDALASGNCPKAYRQVSFYAKNNFATYGSPQDFAKNVCSQVKSKYSLLKTEKIDQGDVSGETVVVTVLYLFKANWMVNSQERSIYFNMRKERGVWRIDGPELQP